jgi:hypothetical protein
MAQQFYKKPTSMGGGGNDFTGAGSAPSWTMPTQLDTTANGTYTITVAAQLVTIVGTGTEKNDAGVNIAHTALVTPTSITVSQTN